MKGLSAAATVALLALAAPAQARVCPLPPPVDLHVGPDGVARPASDPALPPPGTLELPGRRGKAPTLAIASARPRVKRLLREALLDDRITQEEHDAHVRSYDAAVGTWRRLAGVRKAQLGAQIANLDRIAKRGSFTPSRFPALFVQLERNREFWAKNAPISPRPGIQTPCGRTGGGGGTGRVTFEGSELVFQYYPGQGLQLQPLANFGKANGFWNACKRLDAETPCEPERLRLLLDELHATASRRGSFMTWEYYFAFGGGLPPWTSGMSQGTGIQAMARGSELLGDRKYALLAREALGAFEVGPPVGVRVHANGGRHYLLYSFSSGLRVLNGFLQSLVGLWDYAELEDSPKARALFHAGDRAARREVPRFDTGAWSLYSLGGAESDLSYHRLVRDFLRGLCERTRAGAYCRTEARFTRYLSEHTRVRMGVSSRARPRRTTYIRFTLSKRSCVNIVISRGGRVISNRTTVFPYGRHAWAFVPPAAGTYTVKLDARDSRNHHTVVERTLRVRGRG